MCTCTNAHLEDLIKESKFRCGQISIDNTAVHILLQRLWTGQQIMGKNWRYRRKTGEVCAAHLACNSLHHKAFFFPTRLWRWSSSWSLCSGEALAKPPASDPSDNGSYTINSKRWLRLLPRPPSMPPCSQTQRPEQLLRGGEPPPGTCPSAKEGWHRGSTTPSGVPIPLCPDNPRGQPPPHHYADHSPPPGVPQAGSTGARSTGRWRGWPAAG